MLTTVRYLFGSIIVICSLLITSLVIWSNQDAAYYDKEPYHIEKVLNRCPLFIKEDPENPFRPTGPMYQFPQRYEGLGAIYVLGRMGAPTTIEFQEDLAAEEQTAYINFYRGHRKSFLWYKDTRGLFKKAVVHIKPGCTSVINAPVVIE